MQESPVPPTNNPFLNNAAAYGSCVLLVLSGFLGFYYLGLHQHKPASVSGVPTVALMPNLENTEQRTPQVTRLGEAVGKETIADAAQSVAPSVVNIDAFSQVVDPGAASADSEFLFNGTRMVPFQSVPFLPRLQKAGTGSGLIIRSDGYILTNNHVVKGSNRIKVTLSDHRSFTGKIVGRDNLTDLAVVKIPAVNLPSARLGTSAHLRPGEWAIAIGSPLGLEQTVTHGIISAIARSVADVNSEVSFIQTDAPINPGNSGGPLINLDGDVIGINSFIRSDAQNIGFATPIDTAKAISQELISRGQVDRSWVGMKLLALSEETRKKLGISPGTQGVLVAAVVAGSPAEKAGLLAGDIIENIETNPVDTVKQVQECVRRHKPGESVGLRVLRGKNAVDVSVTLVEMPELLD